jgi:nitrile hydratase subunit beta
VSDLQPEAQVLAPGTPVRVRPAFPPGHVRTPAYIRGRHGRIHVFLGHYPNAEEMAYGRPGEPSLPLYQVRFDMSEVWPGAGGDDSLILDLYEHWLEPVPEQV